MKTNMQGGNGNKTNMAVTRCLLKINISSYKPKSERCPKVCPWNQHCVITAIRTIWERHFNKLTITFYNVKNAFSKQWFFLDMPKKMTYCMQQSNIFNAHWLRFWQMKLLYLKNISLIFIWIPYLFWGKRKCPITG